MKPTLLILAAGMGSRYGSLKQIDQLGPGGETIIDYSVYDAIQAGFGKIVFVIRRNIETEFKEVIINKYAGKIEVDYVFQELDILPEGYSLPEGREKPWGTGHAALVAKDAIKEPFALINGDDYYGTEAFKVMGEYLSNLTPDAKGDFSMVGFELKNTLSDFGYVSRGVCEANAEGNLATVVERTKIYKKDDGAVFEDEDGTEVNLSMDSLVSMNFWGFTPDMFEKGESLFKAFLDVRGTEMKSEFYIPSYVEQLISSGDAKVKVLSSRDKWFGVTYKEDKPTVMASLKALADNGTYPSPLWK